MPRTSEGQFAKGSDPSEFGGAKPWAPGISANPGGKVKPRINEYIRRLTDDGQEFVDGCLKMFRHHRTPQMLKFQIASLFLDRLEGKPRQALDATVTHQPVVIDRSPYPEVPVPPSEGNGTGHGLADLALLGLREDPDSQE